MSDLNTYTFTGRLGADAETRYTGSGTAVWSARVAVGYGYGDNKGTNWITAQVFGKRAESLAKLELTKGTQVAVTGELRVREYDRKDGGKGTSVEVNASDVHLIVGKGDKPESSAPRQQRQAPAPAGDFDDSEKIPF
ncbi:single-stranded DNA-binding protein [Frateuria sp. GZRR33]|uniref:single-stranded DNA-binding protein n=1 Tax=Frateuria sp. GZRR33 TaxID=3351535 RepID=UPI003EDBCDDD